MNFGGVDYLERYFFRCRLYCRKYGGRDMENLDFIRNC